MYSSDQSLSGSLYDEEDIANFTCKDSIRNKPKERSMCFRKRSSNQVYWILYPDDPIKGGWDLFVAIILIFTCIVTPYRIALVEKDGPGWSYLSYIIDFSFFIDMAVIFNSAYYDESFALINSRRKISIDYLKGWFTIDLFAIIPFDILFGNGLNQIVRITRIGKMYKLIKLTRLVRILKIFKESNKFFKYME
jgi:hypothetical protein